MDVAAGYDTGAEVDWSEVVYSGLLGALSGGFFEGGNIIVGIFLRICYDKKNEREVFLCWTLFELPAPYRK